MLKDYLNAFYEAIFVYAIIRLIFVNGENIDSRKSGTLMPTLINCWDKFSCWKDLIYSERDLIVGGKELKNLVELDLIVGGKQTFFGGQSSALCKVFRMLLCSFIYKKFKLKGGK